MSPVIPLIMAAAETIPQISSNKFKVNLYVFRGWRFRMHGILTWNGCGDAAST